MSVAGRVIKAIIFSVLAYLLYIELPNFIFQFAQDEYSFSVATISLGDVTLLKQYILTIGFMLVGLTFASAMAVPKTRIAVIWNLIRLFFGIVFWSTFLAAGLNDIGISANYNGLVLDLTVTLTIMFYMFMGANIFQLVILILDFFIGYEKPVDKKKREAEKGIPSDTSPSMLADSLKPKEVVTE